jgi:hypothetical protein
MDYPKPVSYIIGRSGLCLCLALACACSKSGGSPGAASQTSHATSQATRTVKMSGAIHIPVLLLEAGFPDSALDQRREALVVLAGGVDEPPQGTTGFEVTSDGRYLVSDPVRKRIAIYDSSGTYKGEWAVGFPVDSIAEAGNGLYLLHPSDSSKDRFFDIQGKEHEAPGVTPAPALVARLTEAGLGVLDGRKSGGPLNISMGDSSLRLISLQPLGSAPDGSVYVALEVTPGGETVTVQKQVREYGAAGNVLAEVTDIPLNYDFPPTDELKVRRDVLYQLEPMKSAIGINRWNMDGGK